MTPDAQTTAQDAARIAARKPITGWMCLNCGTETPGDCIRAIPCCPDQFSMRVGFLPPTSPYPPKPA